MHPQVFRTKTVVIYIIFLLLRFFSFPLIFGWIVIVILLSDKKYHDLFRLYCDQISLVALHVYSFVHLSFDRQIYSGLNRNIHVDSSVTYVQLRPKFRMSPLPNMEVRRLCCWLKYAYTQSTSLWTWVWWKCWWYAQVCSDVQFHII